MYIHTHTHIYNHVINKIYTKYNFIAVCVSDHWIVPDIIGEAPPPCSGFTFTSLPNNRVMLFGGNTPNGPDDTFYICQCTKTTVVS